MGSTSKSELLDPLGPLHLGHAPRVALVLQVLDHDAGLGGEARLHHHLVAAHVDDVVDVLDVDRALLDAGAAVGAGPQHVGVDDARRGGVADQRPLRPRLQHVLVEVRRAPPRWPACTGALEGVVAQLHDQHLGRQRLAGVPGRALGLAAAALGAGGEVEEALPGEVLDLAPAEAVSLVEVLVLEVDGLPSISIGCAAPSAVGRRENATLSGASEDVQVLGVDHDDQEHQHDADVQQQADVLEHLVGRAPAGEQRGRTRGRRKPPSPYGKLPVLAAAPRNRNIVQIDVEDHEQDEPGAAEVRARRSGTCGPASSASS